jgi:hypothetical protein
MRTLIPRTNGVTVRMGEHGDQPSEQERLFAAANPHLQALIIAALETACRVGELLSLQ